MVRNLRYAVRSLLRAPGYAVAFVLTLGLGIGLNTAIFSVVNGVLLEPLPYQDADRILYVRQEAVQAGVNNARFSFNEVRDYREGSRTIDQFNSSDASRRAMKRLKCGLRKGRTDGSTGSRGKRRVITPAKDPASLP